MQETNTAAATALVPSEPETKTMVRLDWTPESLSLEIEREKAMRHILQQYMRDAMIDGHHYYSFKEGDPPALTQEGAHNICSVFKTIIGPPVIEKEFHEDGHLTVSARVHIFNQSGEMIATGDGMCSTKESKYAYRWGKDTDLPPGYDRSTAKTRGGTNRGGGEWKQYQIPNQDLADLYNTVLKMGVKRAKVAAVRQLPLVSELFTPDDDEPAIESVNKSVSPTPGRASAAVRTSGTHSKAQPSPVPPKESAVEVVVALIKKLTDRGVDIADLNEQFLPGGVSRFEDLTDEAADNIRNDLVALLNAKLAETRGK